MLGELIKDIFTCESCYWAEQCPGGEICEMFDSLDEFEIDTERNIICEMERTTYRAEFFRYIKPE